MGVRLTAHDGDIPGVLRAVNTFYVRSFAQVIGMLTATVAHAAATAVHATRRTR